MDNKWTGDNILELIKAYQPACILTAACDLDVFSKLNGKRLSANELAAEIDADPRSTAILLDSTAALGLIRKEGAEYSLPQDVAGLLTEDSPGNILPMVRHHSNCLRRWANLAYVAKFGKKTDNGTGIRGEAADQEAFIGAMHNFSAPIADELIKATCFPDFQHILDIGGASGTWTIAFINAYPHIKATIFDLPNVIAMAKKRIAQHGLTDRVSFVPGDYNVDELPGGADFVWLSAIAHQNSPEQNDALFSKIYAALQDGGLLVIRDVVMDESRTTPPAGALFAVNMLVGTEGGNAYTFEEYRQGLIKAGFTDVSLMRQTDFMDSLICAKKMQ